jgi:hypothetical protein
MRKYRQQGYQDVDRPAGSRLREFREPRGDGRPRRGYGPREPRKVNMPGFHEVTKCARCGAALSGTVRFDSQCSRCSTDLHTCAQCTWFDTGSQFECVQPIKARVSPKDERNTCSYFAPCVTVERETRTPAPAIAASSTAPSRQTMSGNARQAFDDLFK